MKVELFYAPGCAQCAGAVGPLRAAAESIAPDLTWREVNVLESLDRAVELGVLTLPALAIDDELVFPALPKPDELRQELGRRRGGEG